MMSLATIAYLSREQAVKAAAARKVPFLVWPNDLDAFPPFPFPNIGDYRPKGWRLVDSLFVDKTGLGRDWEPALTAKALKERIKVGMGYAIIQEGEFQAVVGEFEKA